MNLMEKPDNLQELSGFFLYSDALLSKNYPFLSQ